MRFGQSRVGSLDPGTFCSPGSNDLVANATSVPFGAKDFTVRPAYTVRSPRIPVRPALRGRCISRPCVWLVVPDPGEE